MAASPEKIERNLGVEVVEGAEKEKGEHDSRGAEDDEEKGNGGEVLAVEGEIQKKKNEAGAGRKEIDLEVLSCLLQPGTADSDLEYIGIRRLLLYRKGRAVVDRRKGWQCNGRGFVAYRNYINRPRNWESLSFQSLTSTPNLSDRWNSSQAPLSLQLEVGSFASSRDLRGSNQARASFSSSMSDSDRFVKKAEPAYSFVGMQCIFDQCKVSVTVLKFGHMSSDLLAYGAADGSVTVCIVSDSPRVYKLLTGHSRDVTGWLN